MLIGGLQKTTLIDFPKHIACTVFTIGCNFRCPFCHNKDLVSSDLFKKSKQPEISEKDFISFIKKRKKILDGVCITGGEPTLQPDLVTFCRKIKDLKLEVKLDTNGSHPKILKKLIQEKLVNFIAMDIKTDFNNYKNATLVSFPISSIKQSIEIILNSKLDYEFMTTVVPTIHSKDILIKMARDLKTIANKFSYNPDKINYILQAFRPINCFNRNFLKLSPLSTVKMKNLLKSVREILPNTKLRE